MSGRCRGLRALGRLQAQPRAWFTNASPAGVTSTLRLVRANSLTPSSLSKDLICRLRADCTTKQR